MARSSAGVVVAGLTAAALAVVGFLAYQASAAQDRRDTGADRTPAASASPSPGAGKAGERDKANKADGTERTALPPGSGTGERIVYSLGSRRVWLVGANEQVTRTYRVVPGAVDPEPGEYAVTSRTERVTGSDGVPVAHVVLFTQVEGTVVGFSAAVDGSLPTGAPKEGTGGVRERPEDGEAMWKFATVGTKVVVVP
ncbi:L,D-transpeptidase [Streptomyces sp. TRM 70361]|uniref:L,D-transpeptidase n=1 Tax=Streptomyces sp. TRM 70361 TaxID=3116553 RepID=UPI002E7AE35D|nr:L,D-transpeptidase [Streptomyces sp. TRM 70361]MEE1940576.1 L,D-transpeptidase [Streptomyces sp. TRM 70361]